ncbi:MAG: hypothetical protein ACOCP8_02870 [archaeon]
MFKIKKKPEKYYWAITSLFFPVHTSIIYLLTCFRFKDFSKKIATYWMMIVTTLLFINIGLFIAVFILRNFI